MAAGTLVFIFLLENFPDNIQNKSLQPIEVTSVENPTVEKCDSSITDPILQIVSRELDVLMVPKWVIYEKKAESFLRNNSSYFNATSYETALSINKVLDDSMSAENQKIDDLEYLLDKSDFEERQNVVENVEEVEERMDEHLVAIFESLNNVTAQTCGGTLLAPRWVLTAASCVNLLSNVYDNSTTIPKDESVYTIIVNATDPLTDGTAHNVTEVHLHPVSAAPELSLTPQDLDDDIIQQIEANVKPDLALMKIDPPAEVGNVKIDDVVTPGMLVMVYGWAVSKNETTHDAMRATRIVSRALTQLECASMYNITEGADLCLATSEANAQLCAEMNWGGPVTHNGALVGVARADGRAPVAAWPLASHTNWILNIMNDRFD